MGQKDKLIRKLLSKPKDFTFDEVESLLEYYNYHKDDKGRTSGSRVAFINDTTHSKIIMHRPHPRKNLLDYQVKQLIDLLKDEGLL